MDSMQSLIVERSKQVVIPCKGKQTSKQCKAKSKRSGNQCNNQAMYNKNVCRMHGGKAGRPPTHGLTSKELPAKVAEQRKVLLDNKEQLLDLEPLIATLKAKLDDKQDTIDLELLSKVIDTTSKVIERHHKIEAVLKQGIPKEQVSMLINRIVLILNEHLGHEEAKKIIEKIRQANNAVIP